MSQPDDPPAPEPAGPFYSTWGPLDGPILRSHEPPAIGVVGEPGGAWHICMAFPAGQVEHRRGAAVTWRLIIRKVELEGRWLCVRREFIKLGDAVPGVRGRDGDVQSRPIEADPRGRITGPIIRAKVNRAG